jgi:hypothetical protein
MRRLEAESDICPWRHLQELVINANQAQIFARRIGRRFSTGAALNWTFIEVLGDLSRLLIFKTTWMP